MTDSQILPASNDQSTKKRAACDECRTKKLKCTGEQPACSRCVRENITCVYSPQRQMGRPKKRQRTDGNGNVDADQNSSDHNPQSQTYNFSGSSEVERGFDASGWDSTLVSGLNLPSWLGSGNSEWDMNTVSTSTPAESALPALTPDSSSNSPPTLNLPPELQNISLLHSHNHQNDNSYRNINTSSTDIVLDPSLTNSSLPLLPNCACLSTLYLTLNNLSTMDAAFPFPYALHPLREAMTTASAVLQCPECPTRFISAIQNTQLVGTLLVSLAERFSRILQSITDEATRAADAGETKKFRLADLNTNNHQHHLHTGGVGCAAAFSVSITPAEWRSLAKKVVRAEVYGPSDGNECCAHFVGLLQLMENRQNYYHGNEKAIPEDFPRDPQTGLKMGGHNIPKEDHLCLKLVGYSRKLIEGFDWS